MTLDCLLHYAPIGTAGAAISAFLLAFYSISVQRKIARCRAAVDFFVKAEMDEHMITAFRDFDTAIAEFKKYISVAAFVKKEDKHYRAIQRYLNIHELMAVSIHSKIFDQHICYSYWADILVSAHNDTLKVIDHIRAEPGGAVNVMKIFLHESWNGHRWIWQKWRSNRWPWHL